MSSLQREVISKALLVLKFLGKASSQPSELLISASNGILMRWSKGTFGLEVGFLGAEVFLEFYEGTVLIESYILDSLSILREKVKVLDEKANIL